MVVEKVIVVVEIKVFNQENVRFLENFFFEQEIEYFFYEEFKLLIKEVKVIIRIGEFILYVNCILQVGVFFQKGGWNMQIEMKDIYKVFGKN